MIQKIVFVTGNEFKFKLVKDKLHLDESKVCLERKKIECPEIQADSMEEIAKNSAKYAASILKLPCIKNDSGLLITALKGFPGPYTKYIENTITEKGILKLLIDTQLLRFFGSLNT